MPLRLEPGSGRGAVGIGERPPEPRDVRLQRLRGGRRRALAPEIVDERVLRHDLVRAEEEGGEQRTLLGAAEVDAPAVLHDLEWAEDPKLHPALTPLLPRADSFERAPRRTVQATVAGLQPIRNPRTPRSLHRPPTAVTNGGGAMLHRTVKRLATGAAVALTALVATAGATAADAVVRPDDRAVHGPGALVAAQRDVVLRPDDRADRRLPNDAPVTQPTTGEAFDWVDAGIGSAATLGLVLLLAGASMLRLRHGTQTA